MTLTFWLSFGTLLYIYAGYPLLVWGLARLFGREPRKADITPAVSLLLPVYNEEAYIEQKLRNSLALDYPKDKLEIVVASDGSTDRTNALVKRFEARGVRLLAVSDNIGKSAVLSRAVPLLRADIVVFSDATITLAPDAIRRLVRSFADPSVGAVSAAYRLDPAADLRSQGEGLYWRYESFIKRQESRLHSVIGAHGPCHAIRKPLFARLETTQINDDYLIPMRVITQGYRVVYDPEVVVGEHELVSVGGEFARRRRIAAGNCQQMVALARLLHPRHGWVAFCFFSHKVLRTLAPAFLICLLVSSARLPAPGAALALGLQGLFYGSALAGYACQRRGKTIRWLAPPLYFCLGNLAMLAGLYRYCFHRHRLVWERAR